MDKAKNLEKVDTYIRRAARTWGKAVIERAGWRQGDGKLAGLRSAQSAL